MMWFWTFMILVYLIMLNMLLAIVRAGAGCRIGPALSCRAAEIMDVYTGVKSKQSSNANDTVWGQLWHLAKSWRAGGDKVPDKEVINKLRVVGSAHHPHRS